MEKKLKTFKCKECGAEYQKEREQRNHRCINCALNAVGDTVRQLHAHEGPAYDKWRKAMKRAARRL